MFKFHINILQLILQPFLLHLPLHEPLVGAVLGDELVVRALFYDFAMVHDDDLISVPDRGEPVGDDNAGLLLLLD